MSALVAKLADALDSGSSGATLGGSNPLERSEASERFHLPDAIKDWVQKDLGIMGLRPYGIRNKVGVKEAKEESEYKCLDPLY